MMRATVGDMVAIMNRLAPPDLAETWDNCGLQAGCFDQEVKTVLVALDPSSAVVRDACDRDVDLLITHHPLFLSPPRSVDFSRMPGTAIFLAATHGLSIFSAHTNLDSAEGGLNDRCAECIGLQNVRVLSRAGQTDHVKLAFFVPVEHEARLLEALAATPAGAWGRYSSCSFSVRGTGRFQPLEGAVPFIGRTGEIVAVEEVRVEAIVPRRDLDGVVRVLKQAHPYETMAYDVFPLAGGIEPLHGLGRIGEVEPSTLEVFAGRVKQRFGVDRVGVAGDMAMPVKTVAVCSGAGSSLIRDFLTSGADVFVSGDLKYHDAMAVVEAGRALIDVGHFETEHLVVELLVDRLTRETAAAGYEVRVAGYAGQRNPCRFI
ncbi:Nif3-like dinuclear metal center hexameric protein [Desulfosudis oleivorans]|uniref:GTP cyclohydrolase 1 type 2 homolog n=1 Tax=Desulfosudis oleivorans (strain DSM 6200 / JCM 39069 / Hxd3) TaxID=96561 RepID=A8ZUC2_DESOH|nr:Nif3-like dinuclear metal center hexameric protein [Desulfosudis oleivorans]ABW67954.1 protein of unknown function DUF34 [Desulfosudis oleivorans Hxd3]